MAPHMRIGIDLGGTKIEGIAIADDGAERLRQRIPAPRGDYSRTLAAIAGEWGHNPLPSPRADESPGPRCYCGRNCCIETFLSGPGLARDYLERGGDGGTAKEIAARAAAGGALALATLTRYEERMARAL